MEQCTQCQMLFINGIPCHETGCPADRRYACHECGTSHPSQYEADECCAPIDVPVEAYGVRGAKSKPWRRKFASYAAFEAWLDAEDGDVEVQGTRILEG